MVEKQMRLDRFLAEMGQGTRSGVREQIRKGRVTVNGSLEKKPERKIEAGKDQIVLDGREISYVCLEYYMLNKPAGVLSATEDKKRETVVDLITEKSRKDLFPVGRLDLDTEGLLLITNDGELAHQLLAPKNHVDKVYYARCKGRLDEEAIRQFEAGFVLPDGLSCLPAGLKVLDSKDLPEGDEAGLEGTVSEVLITLWEGKFHQVKRMMEAAGCPVLYLKRLSMGPIRLDPALKPGEYRPLTEEEVELLKKR